MTFHNSLVHRRMLALRTEQPVRNLAGSLVRHRIQRSLEHCIRRETNRILNWVRLENLVAEPRVTTVRLEVVVAAEIVGAEN